jgi:hypothetical protein
VALHFVLFSKITVVESICHLSAHIHRECVRRLSAKGPSLAGRHRVAIAESFLSVKDPP